MRSSIGRSADFQDKQYRKPRHTPIYPPARLHQFVLTDMPPSADLIGGRNWKIKQKPMAVSADFGEFTESPN